MLMGRTPGGQPLPLTNAYSGAQAYTGAPLQPYPLPQPVPRPPVMPQPPAPAAALPPAIEAWRNRLLSMHPLLLQRQFGMSPGQLRQLLEDPQTATQLFLQMRGAADANSWGFRGARGADRDLAGQRAADSFRAGMADFSLGNVASALGFGSRMLSMEGLIGLGLQGMGSLALPGVIDSPLPEFEGEINVRDIVAKNPDIAAAIRELELEPNPTKAVHMKARIDRRIREEAMRERVIKDAQAYGREQVAQGRTAPTGIANSGGMGRPGTPGAPRSTGPGRFTGGDSRSGGGNGGQGRSSGAGPGGRGPRGGGAYGGMGGVGAHGV